MKQVLPIFLICFLFFQTDCKLTNKGNTDLYLKIHSFELFIPYRKVPYLVPSICNFSKANYFVTKNFIARIKAILNFPIYPLTLYLSFYWPCLRDIWRIKVLGDEIDIFMISFFCQARVISTG